MSDIEVGGNPGWIDRMIKFLKGLFNGKSKKNA